MIYIYTMRFMSFMLVLYNMNGQMNAVYTSKPA